METSLFVKGIPASVQSKLTFFLIFYIFCLAIADEVIKNYFTAAKCLLSSLAVKRVLLANLNTFTRI